MWMFIMAVIQYVNFVRIFNTHISHFALKTALLGWIAPAIFPCLVVLMSKNGGYAGQDRCWINEPVLLYLTFVVPISFVILCNLVLFLVTLKSIFHRDPAIVSYQTHRAKLQVGAALCCFVSIGESPLSRTACVYESSL
jgi:hypothetical protein